MYDFAPNGTTVPVGTLINNPPPVGGANDWNQQWNQIWNQAWNAGYNNGARPSVASSFGSAVDQGYSAGQKAKASRSSSQAPSAPTGGGGGGGGGTGTTNINDIFKALGLGDIAPVGWNPPNGATNVNDAINAVKGQIETGFNDIMGQLDQQAGLIPAARTADTQRVNDTASSLLTGLNTAQENANKSIDLSKTQIQSGVDKSVSDIQNNLRALLKNAQSQIGAVGAGNSSAATTQIPYAFSKQYAQARGNIQGQANSQFTDLDKKALDVQTTYSTQKTNLDQWTNQQLQGISDKYTQLLTDISNARINATGQKAQALAGLQTQLLTAAQNEVANIRANQQSFAQQLQGWVLDRLATLDNAKLSIGNAGAYTPSNIVYNELKGLNQVGGGGQTFAPVGSFTTTKKDQFGNFA